MEIPPGKADALAEKYDLAPLFDDIRAIIDVPGAIYTVAKWAGIVPIVTIVLAWIVTIGEPTLVRGLYIIGAAIISLAAAVLLGVFVLLRRRFESAESAIGRTLETVEQIHGDVAALRDGERNRAQVIQMAENLVNGVVLPAMDEAVLLVPESSVPIPLPGFLVEPLAKAVTWGPKRVVHRGVMRSVEALPWENMVDQLATEAERAADTSALLSAVRDAYAHVRSEIEGHTRRAARVVQGPVLLLLVLALLPILFWLAIGLVI